MIEESKIVKVVSLINKLTKQGELIWTINRHPAMISLSGDEKLNGYAYETVFNSQKLRLFKFNSTFYSEYDTWEVSSHYRLSFVEPNGLSMWDFPLNRTIDDLYETVRFKTSNVESFFDNLNLDTDEEELPF